MQIFYKQGTMIEAVIRGLDSEGLELDEKRINFTTLGKIRLDKKIKLINEKFLVQLKISKTVFNNLLLFHLFCIDIEYRNKGWLIRYSNNISFNKIHFDVLTLICWWIGKLETTSFAYEATTLENQRPTTNFEAFDTFNATIKNITKNEAVVVIEAGSNVLMFKTSLYLNSLSPPVVNYFNRESEITFVPISSLPSGNYICFI